ncbi:Fic family protein [uncultured Adlercreutzia sp.]|uniref:Fic family protein n=1 Tax=uncultured Adlercreutzia sp. TaxID=875803 RepID=UPI0025D76112|nr:Fic family protein [uncultured Adlercreutzia sp.]
MNDGPALTRTSSDDVLALLQDQRRAGIERGFYWENQIAFAYNSNKMEGSPLTEEQTRSIFETRTVTGRAVPFDAQLEAVNHFKLFDFMLDTARDPLTPDLLLSYHGVLKAGVEGQASGTWKTVPNGVGGITTTPPSQVASEIDRLLNSYGNASQHGLREIVGFHYFFECIHPFQDGNGRIGRMVMFKECLANDIDPFIVLDEYKADYYKGLDVYAEDPALLEGFASRMQELYMAEYANLVPEYLLLPQFEKFRTSTPTFDPQRADDFFTGA